MANGAGKRLTTTRKRSLESYKQVYFRRLNDVHIAAQVTCAALDAHRRSLVSLSKKAGANRFHHYEVPSAGRPTARIRRERRDVEALVKRAMEAGEYQKSLVLAVSITEDYIINILKLLLRAHPERLVRGVKGGDARSTIQVEDFVSRGRDEIIEELIRARISGVLYGKPAEYLKYLAMIMEIEVPQDTLEAFFEIKATRDIIVHADGRVNDRYVEKAGGRARAEVGKLLVADRVYFDGAIAAMKNLIRQIHDGVCAKYAEDEEVRRQAAHFQE
ncbi:MAG: hypothetical protein WCC64_02165 [Aliidongia sp.]